ncbi:MAG: hypothetical protein WBV23_12510 [Desulfobaccales bacterium]
MSNWVSIFTLLVVILINGCAAPPKPNARSDFEELCQTLGKTDGKISKEDLLAAVSDREQAEKIFDMCEKNKQGFLTVEEAARQDWAIRQLLMLYLPPKLPPPRGGRK